MLKLAKIVLFLFRNLFNYFYFILILTHYHWYITFIICNVWILFFNWFWRLWNNFLLPYLKYIVKSNVRFLLGSSSIWFWRISCIIFLRGYILCIPVINLPLNHFIVEMLISQFIDIIMWNWNSRKGLLSSEVYHDSLCHTLKFRPFNSMESRCCQRISVLQFFECFANCFKVLRWINASK